MLSRRLWSSLSSLLFVGGCVGVVPAGATGPGSAVPGLTVSALRRDGTTGALRPLSAGEKLRADEPVTLEIKVDRPAHVSAVLYSQRGQSEELAHGDESALLLPERSLRIVVPRRAPPGVHESALLLFVAASLDPLMAPERQLLHLPCGGAPGRGDGEKPKPPDPPPAPKPQTERSVGGGGPTGLPGEGKRGDDQLIRACTIASGVSRALAIRSLVLESE